MVRILGLADPPAEDASDADAEDGCEVEEDSLCETLGPLKEYIFGEGVEERSGGGEVRAVDADGYGRDGVVQRGI
jgi:hypothetical protein